MEKINVEKSTVLTNNTEDLKVAAFGYLNKDGYFSHLQDFSQYRQGNLEAVTITSSTKHPYRNRHDSLNEYEYFIPKDKVVFESEEPEEPKKYYRPFKTVGELLDSTEVVKYLKFRSKCGDTYYLSYNGYEIDKFGTIYIHLGSLSFTLHELFDSYEYSDDTQWLPFGVECEKDEAEYM